MPSEYVPSILENVLVRMFHKRRTFYFSLQPQGFARMFWLECSVSLEHIYNHLKLKQSSMFQMFSLKGRFLAEHSPLEHSPLGREDLEQRQKDRLAGRGLGSHHFPLLAKNSLWGEL